MDANKKFFIIMKKKYSHTHDNYFIHDENMYDLTTAVKKLLALDTLNEDRKRTSYHLQEVNFSMVSNEYINKDKSKEPLVLTDEVKEDKNWKECIDESLSF
jgi:hypothetical protein